MNPNDLAQRIALAFGHLYPSEPTPNVMFGADESISVLYDNDNIPTFICQPESDNDDYLRFGILDEDYDDEHPEEAVDDFLQIRIRVLGE